MLTFYSVFRRGQAGRMRLFGDFCRYIEGERPSAETRTGAFGPGAPCFFVNGGSTRRSQPPNLRSAESDDFDWAGSGVG